jgi:hypothetical protein
MSRNALQAYVLRTAQNKYGWSEAQLGQIILTWFGEYFARAYAQGIRTPGRYLAAIAAEIAK